MAIPNNPIDIAWWATKIILSSVGPYGFSALLIPLLLGIYPFLPSDRNDPESPIFDQKVLQQEYDFIIIGGGSAGSVLASRLSEIPTWKILLLEAGEDENPITDVPALASNLQMSKIDWQYLTEPSHTHCLGMINGRCAWPRGKVLGGSSTNNFMLYIRGNKNDYDNWERLGNPGWGYNDVLKYFIKSEDNRNPYIAKSPYHGTNGPLTVQDSQWKSPMSTAFVEAGEEIGYPNIDVNGADQAGFMMPQGTLRRGQRCSANKAFLKPVKLRDNLDIALNAYVTRILIDEGTKRAYGVKFVRDGKTEVIYTRKEVILSAGTINSPQLLMLSGIGPHEELSRHGIQTIVDLPGVGRNLQDHVGIGGLVFTIDQPVSLQFARYNPIGLLAQYILKGRGPLTSMAGSEGVAFVASSYGNVSWPDIQLQMSAGGLNSALSREILNLRDDIYNDVYQPLEVRDIYTLAPNVARPTSRGQIKLKSKNPKDKPLIYANYLDDPLDMRVIIDGIKICLRLSEAKGFQALGSRLWNKPLPPCKHIPYGSDEYWECHIRTITLGVYHPVGTCKMGPQHDEMAVVDSKLRLYGTAGLRVIDASIMPVITTANTGVPVIMIAEKASDMIKEAWHEGRQYGSDGIIDAWHKENGAGDGIKNAWHETDAAGQLGHLGHPGQNGYSFVIDAGHY